MYSVFVVRLMIGDGDSCINSIEDEDLRFSARAIVTVSLCVPCLVSCISEYFITSRAGIGLPLYLCPCVLLALICPSYCPPPPTEIFNLDILLVPRTSPLRSSAADVRGARLVLHLKVQFIFAAFSRTSLSLQTGTIVLA